VVVAPALTEPDLPPAAGAGAEKSEEPVAVETEREPAATPEDSVAGRRAPRGAAAASRAAGEPVRRPAESDDETLYADYARTSLGSPGAGLATGSGASTPPAPVRAGAADRAVRSDEPRWADDAAPADVYPVAPVVAREAVGAAAVIETRECDGYAGEVEEAAVVVSFADVVSAGWVSDVPAAALVQPAGVDLTAGGAAGAARSGAVSGIEVVIPE